MVQPLRAMSFAQLDEFLTQHEPDRVRICVRPASIASWNQGEALARAAERFRVPQA